MTIKLPSPIIVNIPINPSTKAVTFSELKLRQSVDNPTRKTVSVYFVGAPLPLIIWSGSTYDSIGNWTQEQLELEIKTKVSASPTDVINEVTSGISVMGIG
jgi:hypothetical protein